jgi:hypothetical protein
MLSLHSIDSTSGFSQPDLNEFVTFFLVAGMKLNGLTISYTRNCPQKWLCVRLASGSDASRGACGLGKQVLPNGNSRFVKNPDWCFEDPRSCHGGSLIGLRIL